MDNIGDLLSSISPEDMERLKNVASSLMSQSGSEPSSAPKEQGAGGNRMRLTPIYRHFSAAIWPKP